MRSGSPEKVFDHGGGMIRQGDKETGLRQITENLRRYLSLLRYFNIDNDIVKVDVKYVISCGIDFIGAL